MATSFGIYCPENTSVIIEGVRIQGLANEFLNKASPSGFQLRLSGASEHYEFVKSLKGRFVPVFITHDLTFPGGEKNTEFDIQGNFYLVNYDFSSGCKFPEVTFYFTLGWGQ